MALSDYLADELIVTATKGDEARLEECLFCNHPRTMKVNMSTGRFICFFCDERGAGPKLVMAIEDCSWGEAQSMILRMAAEGIRPSSLSRIREALASLEEEEDVTDEEWPKVNDELPTEFVRCCTKRKVRIPASVKQRDISKEQLKRWEIGYCLRGEYAGRVIVPISNRGVGKTFLGRAMSQGLRPKYKNPASAALDHLLFGLDDVSPGEEVVAVEGAFDAMRLWSYGITSVAYFGLHLRPQQIATLSRLGCRVILMPDGGDDKAFNKALKTASSTEGRLPGTRIARLPSGVDPDNADEDVVREAIATALPPSGYDDPLLLRLSQIRELI